MESVIKTTPVISPEGELGTIPAENLKTALDQGFTEATPKQITEHNEAQVYGSHFLVAGLAGATRGALPFGAGAAILRAAGVSKEVQEKLAKYNPASTTAGELLGAATPETGLLNIAGKAGKLASGLTKLVGIGEEAGIAGKIASAAVRGAGEGATFGASNVANDAVIGDPNLVAQHALSEVGTSALWGAGLGAGLGLASVGIPKGVEAAKSAATKLKDSLGIAPIVDTVKQSAKEGLAGVSSAVSGVSKQRILEAFENIGKEDVPLRAKEFAESLQTLHKETDSALREAINSYEAFTPQTQEAIGDYLKSVDTSKNNGDFARQFMYKSKDGLKIDAGKVETFLKNTKSAKGVKSADAFASYLDSSTKLLDQLEHESLLGASEGHPDLESIKNLVEKNRGALEAQQEAALGEVFHKQARGHGGLGESALLGAVGHTLGIPHPLLAGGVAVFESLRNPIETLHKLGSLQRTITKSADKIAKLSDTLASSSTKGFVAGKLSHIDSKEQYNKVTQQIQSLNDNLEGTVNTIHDKTAILDPHAPAVASAMRDTAGRAISFLSSKIHPMTAPGPLARNPEPSRAQIAAFSKYYRAVDKPLTVLDDALKGTLTHEGVEALTVVHPALFNQMKQSLMTSLASNKKSKELPYHRKLMLSLLLGQDLDGSTNPQSMMMNQQMLAISGAQAEAKEQAFIGQPKPTVGGLEDLTASERALTAQQASAQRID